MNILLLGGDERSIYLNKILKDKGHSTSVHKKVDNELKNCLMTSKFDVIILPIPTKYKINNDKLYISLNDTYLNENLIPKKSYCVYAVKGDISNHLIAKKCINLLEDEKFAFDNAYITAEAALCIMLNNKYKTLKNSKCLISGMGRIGSCLYKLLLPICNEIFVATSNPSNHLLWANSTDTISYEQAFNTIKDYDFIVNTAPKNIFGKLENLEGLYYELASTPYGFNFKEIFSNAENNVSKKSNKDKIIMCPSLPAKYYPFDAAKIIYECMQHKIFD